MPLKKKQHYVARGGLVNFCDNKGRLWVRDCEKKDNRQQRKEEVAVIGHYYSVFHNGKYDHRLEDELGRLENLALPIIKDLDTGIELSPKSKAIFSIYVALQWLRVPDYQRTIEKPLEQHALSRFPILIKEHFEELIKTHGPLDIDPENWSRTIILKHVKTRVDPEFHHKMMKQNTARIANFLINLNWVILHAEGTSQFVTSDNPVVLLENDNWSLRTKLDITSFQCTKFMTLTPRCALLMGAKGSFVRHGPAPDKVIEDFNRHVARNSRRFLFAKEEKWLSKVAELGDEANRTRDGRHSEK